MWQSEPIELREKRYNYLPARFLWRGELHQIQKIEQVWGRPARGRRPPRTYFRVRCQDNQVYSIFQDIRLNAWYVER